MEHQTPFLFEKLRNNCQKMHQLLTKSLASNGNINGLKVEGSIDSPVLHLRLLNKDSSRKSSEAFLQEIVDSVYNN